MTAAPPALLDYPFAAPPPPGGTIAVAPGIRWLRMPLPFALDHINLWLLDDGRETTIVDTGYGDAPTRALWQAHWAITLAGARVDRIVATHYHPDHMGNAAWLSARFGCGVTTPQTEFLAAHAVHGQQAGYAVADTCAFFARHGMAAADVAAVAARGNRYASGVPELPRQFERILDGDVLAAGGTSWRMIAGHGHSPEHAALHAPQAGVLIAGDMLLPRISTNVSVWPAEPDGDPLARFLDSLGRFDALPADTLVLPSHGLPFRGAALRIGQLRAHHAARLQELGAALAAATGPLSAADVLPVLFRRELDVQQRFFAMGEAIAHLNHLWRQGHIRRVEGDGGMIRFTH